MGSVLEQTEQDTWTLNGFYWAWWHMPLIPEIGRQRQVISEFEASLVYKVSPRTARTTQRNKKLIWPSDTIVTLGLKSCNRPPTCRIMDTACLEIGCYFSLAQIVLGLQVLLNLTSTLLTWNAKDCIAQ